MYMLREGSPILMHWIFLQRPQVECGSSDGIWPRDLDFAGSDSLVPEALYEAYPDLQMYPALAGAVVPVVNIPELGDGVNLKLTGELLVKIFIGNITKWNDAALVAAQRDSIVAARLNNITAGGFISKVVVREETSGTTEVFKKAMNKFSPLWQWSFNASGVGSSATSSSPTWSHAGVVKAAGNDGIAAVVANAPYSIGYVVLRTAQTSGLQLVDIYNRAQTAAVAASVESVSLAVFDQGLSFGNNGDDPSRLTADLVVPEISTGWPIATYTYFVVRKRSLRAGANSSCDEIGSYDLAGCYAAATCSSRTALFYFFKWFWFSETAQALANNLGFVGLPDSVRDSVISRFEEDLKCPVNATSKTSKLVYQGALTVTSSEIGLAPLGAVLGVLSIMYAQVDPLLTFEATYYDSSGESASAYLGQPDATFAFVQSGQSVCATTSSATGLCSTTASLRLPFVALPIAVVFNLCPIETSQPCHGSANSADFYASLGPLNLNASQLGRVVDGTISTWFELGTELGNPVLQGVNGSISLHGRAPEYGISVAFLDALGRDGCGSCGFSSSYNVHESDDLVRLAVLNAPLSIGVLPLSAVGDGNKFVAYNGVFPSTAATAACASDTFDSFELEFGNLTSSSAEGCYPIAAVFDVILPKTADEVGCDGAMVKSAKYVDWMVTNGRVQEVIDRYSLASLVVSNSEYALAARSAIDDISCYGLSINADVINLCPSGSYFNLTAQSCEECSSGKAAAGQAVRYDCTSCDAGYFAPRGTSSCEKCQLGTFAPAAGAGTCEDCPRGRFMDKLGAKNCSSCEAGTFSNQEGVSTCTKCAAGFFEAEEGSPQCSACPSGSVQPRSGETTCDQCSEGTFSSRNASLSCSECQAGRTSGPPFAACNLAAQDFFLTQGGVAESCPSGSSCQGGVYLPVPQDGYWVSRRDGKYAGTVSKCIWNTCHPPSLGENESALGCWTYAALAGPPSACNISDSELLCKKGSAGPLCGSCETGYTYSQETKVRVRFRVVKQVLLYV